MISCRNFILESLVTKVAVTMGCNYNKKYTRNCMLARSLWIYEVAYISLVGMCSPKTIDCHVHFELKLPIIT